MKNALLFLACILTLLLVKPAVAQPVQKLLSYQAMHLFSNPVKKDRFIIYIQGKSITNGEIVFEIWDYRNRNIYQEKMFAADLLPDLDYKKGGSKQKENIIKSRLSTFLDDHNFLTPAIESSEKFDYDEDNSNKAVWYDIKADPTAVGFQYNWGYESTINIAYSKKRRKVVQYFYSD